MRAAAAALRRVGGAIERALAALAALALAIALAVHRLGDFDLPWHLAYGRIVVSTRSIPRVDDLAFTHRPIVHAEFVSDALFYLAHRAGGALALQALAAAIACAAFVVAYLGVRRLGPAALLAASAAAIAAGPWLLARPATVSFLLLAVVMTLLRAHRRAPESRRGRAALLAIAPLHALWANMHGFVVVSVAVTVGYLACRALAKLAGGRAAALLPREDARGLGFATAAIALSTLAACANMAGARLLLGPGAAIRDIARVTEWARPTASFLFVQHPASGAFLVLTVVALAFGADPERGRRAPTLFDAGVVLVAVGLAATAVRLIAPAAILLTPIVSSRLSTLVRATPLMRAVAIVAAWLAAPIAFVNADTSIGVGFERSHFPEGAVQFIERASPEGNMFNFMPFGGYLSWRLYPRHRVLIDGRTGWVHDPELTRRAFEAEHDPRAFASLVGDFDLQWAVCRAREGERFCVPPAASREWAMVYWDDASAVYVRRGGVNERLAQDRYRVLTHLTSAGEMVAVAVEPGRRGEALVHDAKLAAAQDPASVRGAFLLACAAIAQRDVSSFLSSREALVDRSAPPLLVAAVDEAWKMASSAPASP